MECGLISRISVFIIFKQQVVSMHLIKAELIYCEKEQGPKGMTVGVLGHINGFWKMELIVRGSEGQQM